MGTLRTRRRLRVIACLAGSVATLAGVTGPITATAATPGPRAVSTPPSNPGSGLPPAFPTGSISGVVTADGTGRPIASACVNVFTANGDVVATRCTDRSGRYRISDLWTGLPVRLFVSAPRPYLSEWAEDAPDSSIATEYTAPARVNVGLAKGVKVSGTVRDGSGAPLPGTGVFFEPPGVRADLSAITGADGRYTLYAKPGRYTVAFYARGGHHWFAFGRYERSKSPVVTVRAGIRNTVNDTQPPPTRVTGTVTDAQTGRPLSGVCVSGLTSEGDPAGYGLGANGEDACTRDDGRYTLDLPAGGSWRVRAIDLMTRYAYAESSPIRLLDGQTLTGVDLRLNPAGALTGRVVDRVTGAPVLDVCVRAWAAGTRRFVPGQLGGCTDGTGGWTISGLPAGPVIVHVSGDDTHVQRWAPDSPSPLGATPYQVIPNATGTVDAVRLDHGGTLTGRITDSRGRPVAGARVVYGETFAGRVGPGQGPNTAQTDTDGRYTIRNLDQSARPVEVYTRQVHAWQWSGRATDPTRASRVAIRFNRTTRFDAVLQPEATLVVRVTGTGDNPDRWLTLEAFTASGAPIGWARYLHADGTAVLRGFPTSKIKLRITVPSSLRDGHAGPDTVLWYGGATGQMSATPIPVRSGQQTRISVRLR